MSKKHQVIEQLYENCKKRNDFKFHNAEVKEVCEKVGFGNPFDVTKIDDKEKLPKRLIEKDVAITHLGSGYHQFIQGIDDFYHNFESIKNTLDWRNIKRVY